MPPTSGPCLGPPLQLIVDTVRNLSVKEVIRMRRVGQIVYERFFSSTENQALGVLETMRRKTGLDVQSIHAGCGSCPSTCLFLVFSFLVLPKYCLRAALGNLPFCHPLVMIFFNSLNVFFIYSFARAHFQMALLQS